MSILASKRQTINNQTTQEILQSKGKTIQLDIIKRFMTEEQFNEFISQYKDNRMSFRTADRAESLSVPLTDDEKKALKVYLRDVESPVSVLERDLGLPQGHLYQRAARAAVKYLYQNSDKVNL